MAYRAIIIGASGLIGSYLLPILLNSQEYDEVLILVRKIIPVEHKKLTQQVIDFDELDNYSGLINGHAVFSCLGTTLKQTPNKEVYYKLDHDYPVQLAKIAKNNGVQQFHIVSAVGANTSSSNFYIQTKGKVEKDLEKLGLTQLNIYQPSFFSGDRKETRPVEKILLPLFALINPLLIGSLKKFRSISAKTIATAMYKTSLKNTEGLHILSWEQMKNLS